MFFADAQPMAARVAFRIDALHGPAGQILHLLPQSPPLRAVPANRKSGSAFSAFPLVVSRSLYTISSGGLAGGSGPHIPVLQDLLHRMTYNRSQAHAQSLSVAPIHPEGENPMSPFRSGREEGSEIYMSPGSSNKLFASAGMIVLGVILFIILFSSITSVRTGHVAVLTRFGRVTGTVLGEGIHFKNPLDSANEMLVRTQELKETASVPSNEGLIMTLDASLIFRLKAESAPEVFRTLGQNYVETIVEPNLRSAIRSATAAHTANALYTGAREEVAKQIRSEMVAQMATRGVEIENVLLRDIQLPATLKASIEAKQRSEQEALQMSFVLQKEKQEAERKRIEAQGIADYQRIVAQGLSPQILAWKGIEATEKLASSPNSKIVMIGRSNSGLPLIMEPK